MDKYYIFKRLIKVDNQTYPDVVICSLDLTEGTFRRIINLDDFLSGSGGLTETLEKYNGEKFFVIDRGGLNVKIERITRG